MKIRNKDRGEMTAYGRREKEIKEGETRKYEIK